MSTKLTMRMRQALEMMAKGAYAHRDGFGRWWFVLPDTQFIKGQWLKGYGSTIDALIRRHCISSIGGKDFDITPVGRAALAEQKAQHQDTWESLGNGFIEKEPKE